MTDAFLWVCYVLLLCAIVLACAAVVLAFIGTLANAYTYFRRSIRRWRINRRRGWNA